MTTGTFDWEIGNSPNYKTMYYEFRSEAFTPAEMEPEGMLGKATYQMLTYTRDLGSVHGYKGIQYVLTKVDYYSTLLS